MTLQTILVCLTSTSSAARLLEAASILAKRDNAHLVALYVTESLVVYPGIASHVSEDGYQGFVASQRAHAKMIKDIFNTHAKGVDHPMEWRQISSDSGFLADSIIECARSADLVVMSQEEVGDDIPLINNLQERVIKECGRPVLVIPRGYTAKTLGENIVLGWSDTREATRAVHDLMIVAAPDAKVRILRIGKQPSYVLADHTAIDLAGALSRHGPQVEILHREKAGQKVSDILNKEGIDIGADMLASGAFGHSRAYDFVLGAATRALLRDATLPVLYAK